MFTDKYYEKTTIDIGGYVAILTVAVDTPYQRKEIAGEHSIK